MLATGMTLSSLNSLKDAVDKRILLTLGGSLRPHTLVAIKASYTSSTASRTQ
jgi:hypothetical protein